MLKKILFLGFIAILFGFVACSNKTVSYDDIKIDHLGNAGIRIIGEKTIYFDPFNLPNTVEQKADQIYISHNHADRCSPADIIKIVNVTTRLIAPADCAEKLKDIRFARIDNLDSGFTYNIDGISVDTIKAYNVNNNFHPASKGWLGYIITVNGKRIYYSGDTDYVKEIEGRQSVEIAIIINGKGSMSPEDAAKTVNALQPKKIIPIEYSAD